MSSSDIQTFANLAKVCIGMGVLAIPLATYNAGFIATFVFGVLAVIWITYSLNRLIDCQNNFFISPSEDQDPYTFLIQKAIPKYGTWILNFCYIVTLYGAAVAYVITWNTLLSGFDWEIWGFSFGKNPIFWTIIFFVLACPLSLIRSLSSLGIVSIVGNFILIFSIIIVMVYGGITFNFTVDVSMLFPRSYTSMISIFGVLCFSLGVAFIGAASRSSMKKPEHFNYILIGSLVSCLIFYYIFGSISIFTFSNDPRGIFGLILQNMLSTSPFYIISAIGLALTCWLSYPIAVFPATRAVESWVDSKEEHIFVIDWKRILLRLGCLFAVCLIGYLFPHFDNVVSFIGCFTVSAVSFILPFIIHYRINDQQSKKDKIIDIVMTVCGFIIMIVSTACCFL